MKVLPPDERDKTINDAVQRGLLHEWLATEGQVAELRRELADNAEIIALIARERDQLRAENADLRDERDRLGKRLEQALSESRRSRNRRKRDWRGLLGFWK